MPIRRVAIVYDDIVRPDTTGGYCLRALESLVRVEHFRPNELARIPDTGFDLYLSIDDGLDYLWPERLRPSAAWLIDTHLDFGRILRRSKNIDVAFAAQRAGVARLRDAGVACAGWLPLACDPMVHRKHALPKSYDVCFIGNLFPGERSDLLDAIKARWKRCLIDQRFFEEMALAYSAARIVFNRSIKDDLNMRVFEALACGSMLITNDLSSAGQSELFQDGVHLVTYGDEEQLLDKIAQYLDDEQTRERIAAEGRREVLRHHTYHHRMQALLASAEQAFNGGTAGELDVTCTRRPIPSASCWWREPGADSGSLGALVSLVPGKAGDVLYLGNDAESFCETFKVQAGAALRATPTDPVIGLEGLTAGCAIASFTQLPNSAPVPSWRSVVCDYALESATNPLALLKELRARIPTEGELLLRVRNSRRKGEVAALLEGGISQPLHDPSAAPQWRYTRSEIERLLYRASFEAVQVLPVGDSDLQQWHAAGCPNEVTIGPLAAALPGPEDAMELFVTDYLIRAIPCPNTRYGTTSIVIVTHNELRHTRRCIESIQRLTDEPYELILVDNGSTDGTGEYLRAIPGARVMCLDKNVGFPAAANLGIQAAAGEQVLLLNNDVVVTTRWLRRMLETLYADPTIGLVGPVCNNVSGCQQVPAHYSQIECLDGFAWRWAKANAGRTMDVERLVGFCLLIKREALNAVGLLDERFGIGNFEDDDYCIRARLAGYRLVVARDAFVHHVGSASFQNDAAAHAKLLEQNRRAFYEKWSRWEPSNDEPPENAPSSLSRPDRPVLSVCMIVRNSGRTLEAALRTIRPWVDEMVVVDTGSSDNTPEIATKLGARLFHTPWRDDFSAARNESLRHARGQWIFWMDSDDTIDPVNGQKLRALASHPHEPSTLGFIMQVHCPSGANDPEGEPTAVDHIKMIRNLPYLRFEGRIHEQILSAIRRADGQVLWTDIYVTHSGSDATPAGRLAKQRRDFRLLALDAQERPDHPFVLFNLGMTHADAGNHVEACEALERSIALAGDNESHLRKAFALLAGSLCELDETDRAWQACEEGLRRFPDDPELLFRAGLLAQAAGRLTVARDCYLATIQGPQDRCFSSMDRGLVGYKARHNLAMVYEQLAQDELAADQWHMILAEHPSYRSAWVGLVNIALKQRDAETLHALADQIQEQPELRGYALLTRAKGEYLKGNSRVDSLIKELLAQFPDDVSLLDDWCQFLFERADWSSAGKWLYELVRRDPASAAALHNFGAAALQCGRYGQAVETLEASLRLRPRSPQTVALLEQAKRFGSAASDHDATAVAGIRD